MILVLAGTGEARVISQGLLARDINVVASLSGATRMPKSLGVKTRVGGFGGYSTQAQFFIDSGVTAVIDATHPFAENISHRTAGLCAELKIPYLHVRRPEWTAQTGDRWTDISCGADAVKHIPAGSTVFLGTGRQTLDEFSNLSGRRIICRQIDPPSEPFPFEGGEYLVGRPPFSVVDETRLFGELGVDVLVVKNAGGAASATKLTAARDLNIPVLMITRPPVPENAVTVETAQEAITWALTLG